LILLLEVVVLPVQQVAIRGLTAQHVLPHLFVLRLDRAELPVAQVQVVALAGLLLAGSVPKLPVALVVIWVQVVITQLVQVVVVEQLGQTQLV
jgi:hypothetical protein